MINKIEVTIEIIIHATEDIKKILESFENIFGIKREDFSLQHLTGHFENPILLGKVIIKKNLAIKFVHTLISKISKNEINEIVKDIENRIQNSSLYLRLEKQELIKGNIILHKKDSIKVKIYTPIYRKKDTVKIYTKLLDV
jgi:RNA binding exosome subunit